MTKAIIFDIGGVFFTKSETMRRQVLDRYGVTETWLQQLRTRPEYALYKQGQLSYETYLASVDPLLPTGGAGSSEDLFWALSLARNLNSGLVDIARILKAQYRVAVLSNSDSFLERRLRHMGVWNLFEFVINSYRVKLRKPDPRIFQLLMDRLALKPQEVIFVDDKESNIAAAQAMGINGHVFSANQELEDWLSAQGVVLSPPVPGQAAAKSL